jgi:two-component system, NarL family, invasion response regulator UvrY
MINVLITDDHPLVREGMKKILKEETMDIRVMRETSNAGDLMFSLSEELPDLVILDITLPGKNGLDVLREIKTQYPKLPVLMLSMHPEERFAYRAIKAGAWGYLNKSSIADELVNAIRVIVTQKRRYINSVVAEQLAQQVDSNSEKPLHETLSDREFQILCMIVSGKEISAIAEELSLGVQTVHTYKARVRKKMNMSSNVELTRYAIQHNLVE